MYIISNAYNTTKQIVGRSHFNRGANNARQDEFNARIDIRIIVLLYRTIILLLLLATLLCTRLADNENLLLFHSVGNAQ